MACTVNIAKNITSDCSTIGVGGLETKVWIMNRTNIASYTVGATPSKITAIAMKSTKRAWTITGTKKALNCGFDRVVSDDMPDKFTHYFNFKAYQFTASDVENLDALNDVVVVVESKDKATDADGVYRIFGLEFGLYPSTDTVRANDASGARNIELTSLSGQEETQSQYNFDTGTNAQTLAALVLLETPAV